MSDPKQRTAHGQAQFEKKQVAAREGEKAMAHYDAQGRAARVNMEKLKALRLAKEAADALVAPAAKPVKKKLRRQGMLPNFPNGWKARKRADAAPERRRNFPNAEQEHLATVFDFSAMTLDGRDLPLKQFEGLALLIVNTASACGFTPQYEALEQLYKSYSARGFSVLAFPCNQFGGQEPGDARAIAGFCSQNYDVTFPLFAKIDVNGENAHPLFNYLKNEKPGFLGSKAIKWNFTKFIVDRYGKVVARHGPTTNPKALTSEIENLLNPV